MERRHHLERLTENLVREGRYGEALETMQSLALEVSVLTLRRTVLRLLSNCASVPEGVMAQFEAVGRERADAKSARQRLAAYVRAHPKGTVGDAERATGVSSRRVVSFIREAGGKVVDVPKMVEWRLTGVKPVEVSESRFACAILRMEGTFTARDVKGPWAKKVGGVQTWLRRFEVEGVVVRVSKRGLVRRYAMPIEVVA